MLPSIAVVFFILGVVIAKGLETKQYQTVGELQRWSSRIVDGRAARPGQFPHQVAVYYDLNNIGRLCGGSLICDSWVLTAAHCIEGGNNFDLYLGGVNRDLWPNEPGLVMRRASNLYMHPDYNATYHHHDIGLIRLSQKIDFTDNIRPITLGNGYTKPSVKVTLSGWGKTSDASNSSRVLNYVDMDTIGNTNCRLYYGDVIINQTLCCRGARFQNACSGDSGGPLIRYKNGRPYQVGLFSFFSSAGCSSGYPSAYVRVASYRDWITQTIGETCTLP